VCCRLRVAQRSSYVTPPPTSLTEIVLHFPVFFRASDTALLLTASSTYSDDTCSYSNNNVRRCDKATQGVSNVRSISIGNVRCRYSWLSISTDSDSNLCYRHCRGPHRRRRFFFWMRFLVHRYAQTRHCKFVAASAAANDSAVTVTSAQQGVAAAYISWKVQR